MKDSPRKRSSVSTPFRPPKSKEPAVSKKVVDAQPSSSTVEVSEEDEDTREAVAARLSDGAIGAGRTSDDAPAAAAATGDLSDSKRSKNQRVTYKPKEDCLVMQIVLGDDGLFEAEGGSRTERWVKIPQRVKDVTSKDVEHELLRKHVELLEKKNKKLKNKEHKMSGKEPKKTADQIELENMMERYVSKKDGENLAKAERAEIRNKKVEQDRIGGMAIRDAAMRGETREKRPKKKLQLRSNPLGFLKGVSQEVETCRAAKARERLERKEAMHLKTVAF
ncbi:hypothetical protein DVH05_011520 [Phytophthora capsici]|nr:hypothetical protein DVH05_011520 [Phytophthora capsici]